MQRPNILFVLADQHRHDALGCAGNRAVQTPALDAMAAQGVRFERVWCQSPICQPSRASLITGRYPHENGIVQNFQSDFDPGWPTFMKSLKDCGYVTANVGKTHYFSSHEGRDAPGTDTRAYAPDIAAFGFDYVLEEFDQHIHLKEGLETPYLAFLEQAGLRETYLDMVRSVMPFTPHHWDGITSRLPDGYDHTDFMTREALKWIDGTETQKPFFLQLSYVQPHSPLIGSRRWMAHYAEADVRLGPRSKAHSKVKVWDDHLSALSRRSRQDQLSDDYLRQATRAYYSMVSGIDEGIGKIVRRLEDRGQLDNTWIVYSADHGEMLGDHGLMAKGNFYRSSVQVPAIVRPPRPTAAAGSTYRGLCESTDLVATMLDAAGALPPPDARGLSLLPIAQGEAWRSPREFAFSEIGADSNPEALFWAVTDGKRRMTVEANSRAVCEVFDLAADPDESTDLTGTPEGGRIAAELWPYLEHVREETAALASSRTSARTDSAPTRSPRR